MLEANALNPLWDDMNILLFAKNLKLYMFVLINPGQRPFSNMQYNYTWNFMVIIKDVFMWFIKGNFFDKGTSLNIIFFSTFMRSFVDWSSESLQIRSFKVGLLWFVLKLEISARIKHCLLLPLVMSLSSPINFLIILPVEIVHCEKIGQTQRKCKQMTKQFELGCKLGFNYDRLFFS